MSVPTIGDQAVSRIDQFKSRHQILNGFEESGFKRQIGGGQIGEGPVSSFGNNQDMERVGWCRVVKSHQGIVFDQLLSGDDEAEIAHDPVQEHAAKPSLRKGKKESVHILNDVNLSSIVS